MNLICRLARPVRSICRLSAPGERRHTFAAFTSRKLLTLVILMLSAAPLARAQSCQLFPDGGGESISANVILEPTGQTVASGTVVPAGSSLRFDTVATASGNCVSACVTYERNVNHINWRGRMDTITYLDGSKLYFEHNWWFDKVAAVRDALGNVLESHTYDGQGRALTSELHGGVERFTLNYVSGTETDVTDALGRVTKYFFDKSRGRNVVTRVEGSCDCGGSSRVDAWTYDARLNITGKTNALGQTTTYTYDADGNRLTETNALGTTTYTYNAFGQTLTAVDPMNGATLNAYDAHGNLASTTDELGGVTSYTYDARGQLLTVTDPRLNVVAQFDHDAYGNVTRAADALNHASTMTYDARGRLLSATDAANDTTSYTYDAVGRLKTVTRPDNSTVTFTYDLAGRRTRVTDGRGGNTDYTYDNAYRLMRVKNAANGETEYGYDLMSNRTGVTDALGRTTNYTYDDSDRLLKTTYPEASVGAGRLEERLVYDAAGNLTQKIDRAGRATSFAYDAANRLTKVTDAALNETLYEYDARSKATAIVDASGRRYEFTYDSARRLTQAKRAGLTMTFAYDAAGNRTRRTDYNGAVTNYAYDAANRLTTISYPNSTSVTYGYDAASRLTSATNENGAVTVGYDNRDRVSSTTDVWGQAVTYQYDANGNRTAMSLGAAVNTSYQYDVLDRPTQLTDSAGGVFTYGYDAANKLTSRVAPNGVAATYSYDGLDRLTRLKHTKGATTLADFQYQQNAAGNITQITDAAGVHNFSYDAVDRLTSATHPGQTAESYAYDAVGNRASSHLASTYVYQPFNRAVTIGATTYGYDANGNLTSKLDAAGDWEYFWDYENRLVGVWTPDGTVVTYKYDALGRRVETRRGAADWERYSYDGADVVVEHKSDGGTTEYANELGVDEKLWQRTDGAGPLYFVRDHLGSTRALTDSSGTVVETRGYDSFGGGAGSQLTRYGFTGRERDPDTGLYFYRARWYDPATGRFLSEDPIDFKGGDINLYAYVSNNPTRFIDPAGTQVRSAERDRPGDQYPGMSKPYQPQPMRLDDLRCAFAEGLDGFNLWMSGDVGAGLHILTIPGANTSLGMMINLFTGEVCFYLKTCTRLGLGVFAGISGKVGLSLGRGLGKNMEGWSRSLGGDLAVPVGEKTVVSTGHSGSAGLGELGLGVGATLGVGGSLGLDVCYTKILSGSCLFTPDCSCNRKK